MEGGHIRKKLAFLEGIEREKADASVYWRGECLGTWRALSAAWSGTSAGLAIRFQGLTGPVRARVVSIRHLPGGADLMLRRTGGRDETLRVVWDTDGPLVRIESQSLSESARAWIQREIPECRIISETRRSDRAHSLSNAFLRLLVRDRQQEVLVLAAEPKERSGESHEILTQGLLWADYMQRHKGSTALPILYLAVPAGEAGVLFHRARYVSARRARIIVWEYTRDAAGHWIVSPAAPPGPPREERDFRWPVLGPFRWSHWIERAVNLAPEMIRRYPRFEEYDTLRIHGLEFARVYGESRDRLEFGVGPGKIELTPSNAEALRELVNSILYFRRPDSPDIRHPFYTLQSERWLESLILEEVGRLFPELAPEALYSQIPVYLEGETGRVDILGADRQGNLVVMELKVSEDPGLPLQALDYWARVGEHHRLGDFHRRGYFSEIRLNASRPRIYLVSPLFSFHDSTERVLRFLDPTLEVWKIGINQDWRAGVRILHRERLLCGSNPSSHGGD